MQRDDVRLRQNALERALDHAVVQVIDGELHIGIAHQDAAAEGLEQLHDAAAHLAIADEAHRHLGEFLAREVGAVEIAPPLAAAQRIMALGDLARLGEDGADGEFGDGGGIAARRVDDRDAALARRLHVDVDRARRATRRRT